MYYNFSLLVTIVAAAPFNLTVTRLNIGYTRALLLWFPGNNYSSEGNVSYEIFYEYDVNAGHPQFTLFNTTNTNFTTVTSFIIDDTYTFSVIAYRDKGNWILLPSDPSQAIISFRKLIDL